MCDKKLLHVFRFCSDIKFSPKLKSNWTKKKKKKEAKEADHSTPIRSPQIKARIGDFMESRSA